MTTPPPLTDAERVVLRALRAAASSASNATASHLLSTVHWVLDALDTGDVDHAVEGLNRYKRYLETGR